MEINAGFTLVSQDMEESQADITDAAPATVVPIDQEVYLEAGEPFEAGEHVGEAHGTAVLTTQGRLACQITFTFEADPADSIVVHGTLPREGGDIGGGHLAVTGGTGKFHKAAGSVAVETRNPKRWIFSL